MVKSDSLCKIFVDIRRVVNVFNPPHPHWKPKYFSQLWVRFLCIYVIFFFLSSIFYIKMNLIIILLNNRNFGISDTEMRVAAELPPPSILSPVVTYHMLFFFFFFCFLLFQQRRNTAASYIYGDVDACSHFAACAFFSLRKLTCTLCFLSIVETWSPLALTQEQNL